MSVLWQNKIPISAIIFELVVVVLLSLMNFFIFRRYYERKKKPVMYLGLGYLFYSLASLSSCIGRWLGFFSEALIGNRYPSVDPNMLYEVFSFTDFCILFAYCMMAIGNVFIAAFIDAIFIQKGVDVIIPFAMLNGITLGLIIPKLDFEWGLMRKNFGANVYHFIVSISIFGILAYLAIKEAVLNEKKVAKIGFGLIGSYAVLIILLWALFAIDTVLITSTERFSQGYSPAYYAGWSFLVLGSIVGYLGLIMPKWFVSLIMKEEK